MVAAAATETRTIRKPATAPIPGGDAARSAATTRAATRAAGARSADTTRAPIRVVAPERRSRLAVGQLRREPVAAAHPHP